MPGCAKYMLSAITRFGDNSIKMVEPVGVEVKLIIAHFIPCKQNGKKRTGHPQGQAGKIDGCKNLVT